MSSGVRRPSRARPPRSGRGVEWSLVRVPPSSSFRAPSGFGAGQGGPDGVERERVCTRGEYRGGGVSCGGPKRWEDTCTHVPFKGDLPVSVPTLVST